MLDKFSRWMVLQLKSSGVIDENIEDIYEYGFHVMISNILNISCALLVGLIFSRFIEACVFLVSFVVTRRFTGGFNARSSLACFLITVCVMCVAMIAVNNLTVPFAICVVVGLLSLFTAIYFAPIENENKELDNETKKRCRKVSIILVSIQNLIWLGLRCLKCEIHKMVVISLAFITISILIAVLLERRKKHEKGRV